MAAGLMIPAFMAPLFVPARALSASAAASVSSTASRAFPSDLRIIFRTGAQIIGYRHALNRPADQSFNRCKFPLVDLVDERDRRACTLCPGRPADSVYVIFRIRRYVIIEYELDAFYVD